MPNHENFLVIFLNAISLVISSLILPFSLLVISVPCAFLTVNETLEEGGLIYLCISASCSWLLKIFSSTVILISCRA
jgi:hypothetical protein